MLKYSRTFLVRACFVFALSIAAWGVTTSTSYQTCTADNEKYYRESEPKDFFERVSIRLHISRFLLCEGAFIDQNNTTIAALATIAIAGFTLTLWRSTDKLWIAHERTAEQTTKAIEAATKANEIAERAIIEQNRPWVFVKNLIWEPDKSYISIIFTNSGISPARNFAKTIIAHALPVPFPSSNLPTIDPGSSTFLPPGASEILTLNKPSRMPEGYEYRIRIGLSYRLQDGSTDRLDVDFACKDGTIRKVTPSDYAVYKGGKSYTFDLEGFPLPK